jgi:hypothetical protein
MAVGPPTPTAIPRMIAGTVPRLSATAAVTMRTVRGRGTGITAAPRRMRSRIAKARRALLLLTVLQLLLLYPGHLIGIVPLVMAGIGVGSSLAASAGRSIHQGPLDGGGGRRKGLPRFLTVQRLLGRRGGRTDERVADLGGVGRLLRFFGAVADQAGDEGGQDEKG